MIKMLHFATISPLAQQTAGGGFNPTILLFYGLIMAAMWFLLIAPQRKKQKEQQKMISSLSAGDEVLLAGGIYGEITSVRPDRLVVRIGDDQDEIARLSGGGLDDGCDPFVAQELGYG